MLQPADILVIRTVNELRQLRIEDFEGRLITLEEFTHIFFLCDAFWLYKGEPDAKKHHVVLKSKLHSNGFVDTLRVLSYTNLCQIFAAQMIHKMQRDAYRGRVDWVVGSNHAAVDFSHSVAILLNVRHDFPDKGDTPGKKQQWNRILIGEGEIVLTAEELMTSTLTTHEVREGIRDFHTYPIHFAPVHLVLVHRSTEYLIENAPVVFLAHYDIQNWAPAECPYCQAGSEAVKPKFNWAMLQEESS